MVLKEEKVPVTSGKKKTSVRKETSVVSGMRVMIEPSMTRGRSVSKKRSIQGKSNHGAIPRQPCRYYLKGTCTRSPCEYWQPHEYQFYKTETGCKAGDKCLFPYHQVDEQPNKKPKHERPSPQKKRKRRQGCSGYCENCITTGLRLARLGVVGFSKRKTAPGKPDAKVLGSIRKVRFTQSSQRQASIRENKGPSLGKIQVTANKRRSHGIRPYSDAP